MPDPIVVSIPNGQFMQNCYLVADPDFASHEVLGKCDMVLPESVLEAFLAKLPA